MSKFSRTCTLSNLIAIKELLQLQIIANACNISFVASNNNKLSAVRCSVVIANVGYMLITQYSCLRIKSVTIKFSDCERKLRAIDCNL